jgi:CSLREA domain-containing protein
VFNDGINNQQDDGIIFGSGSLNNCGTVSGWPYITVSVQQQNCEPLYVVNTTDDTNDGLCDSLHCSLREAIEGANAEAGLGKIAFDIPGPGPQVIAPASALPAVTGRTMIEGYWQAGAFRNTAPWGSAGNASIMIQLDGINLLSGDGLAIQADSCEVRGLSIVNFPGSGIAVGADLCLVEGNHLGLDAAGTSAGPNGNGISVGAGTTGHRIGGTSARMRNVISGNSQQGIWFASYNPSSLVEGNLVGPFASVATGPGNGAWGIAIENGLYNTIGGTGAAAGNIIAFNGASGVAVLGDSALGNSILGNSTHSNVDQSIDLGGDLFTGSDTGDIDTGPNGLQNFPDLGTAFFSADSVYVTGDINAKPGAVARIEFFATATPDAPLFHGEGRWFLGAVDGVVFQSGLTYINGTVSLPPDPTARYITATATTNEGTSEFSLCVAGQNTATGSNVVMVPKDSTTGGMPVTLTFDDVTTSGFTTLITSSEGPEVPNGGLALGNTYYNIDTDAVHTGVTIAIQYDDHWFSCTTCDHGFESGIALIHWDDTLIPPAWLDITTSVDSVANVAYGYSSTGLSPFVVHAPHLVTGIQDVPVIPAETALHLNVPNPFNPTTTIRYDLPGQALVSLRIYDVKGRLVRTLVSPTWKDAGQHTQRWDSRNNRGDQVSSGVYFYQLTAGDETLTKKMVLLK